MFSPRRLRSNQSASSSTSRSRPAGVHSMRSYQPSSCLALPLLALLLYVSMRSTMSTTLCLDHPRPGGLCERVECKQMKRVTRRAHVANGGGAVDRAGGGNGESRARSGALSWYGTIRCEARGGSREQRRGARARPARQSMPNQHSKDALAPGFVPHAHGSQRCEPRIASV